MFCGNCGNENKDDAVFCAVCGSKLRERTEVAPLVDTPKREKTVSQKKEKPIKSDKAKELKRLSTLQVLLIVLNVVVAVTLVLVLTVGGNGKKQKNEPVTTPSQSVEAEETVATEPEESDASEQQRSLLYGTWGVYYGDVLQTITIQKDGTMYVWDGSYEQVMDYTWVNDTTIQVGELGYIYADGQLVLYENGVQTPFVYQHCPALAGAPNTGASSYEEIFGILTQEYLFGEEHVKCMPNVSKGAICEEILRNQYGIGGQESAGEFLRKISQTDEALAEQLNEYYFEEGGISRIKFAITEWIPRADMLSLFQQEQENYQVGVSPLHKQYVWELARAQMCWVAVGEILYENGESVPLNTDTQQKGVLYLFQIDGRFYWFWSALG